MTRSGVVRQKTNNDAYHQSAMAEDNTTYPCSGETKKDDTTFPHGDAAKEDSTYPCVVAANNDAMQCLGSTIDRNAAYGWSGVAEDDEAGCCVVSPCAALLSSCYATLLLHRLVVAWPPSNATTFIKCHRPWSLLSTAATAAAVAAAGPPPLPPPPLWLNSLSFIAKEKVNSSTTTSIPTAAPT